MKKIIIILFLISNYSFSQEIICSLTASEMNKFECIYIESPTNTLKSNFITEISKEIGISPNFVFKNCAGIENAIATINSYNQKRYILYDYDFFNRLYSSDKMSALYIVAHEMGHHVNGHLLRGDVTTETKRQFELEADYFAGYVIFKFGGTEQDIFNVFKKLPDSNSEYSDHPQNYIRINYALKGFMDEANRYKIQLYEMRNQIMKEVDYEAKEKQINELISVLNRYNISNNVNDLNIADYLLDKIDINSTVVNEIKAYINYKNGRYDLALDYYLNKYKQTRNTDDLIDLLIIISHTNRRLSEIDQIINELYKTSSNPKVLLNLGIYYNKNNNLSKGLEVLKRAYGLIKESENSILKSDVFFAYGRSLYNQELSKGGGNFTFAKMLLMKSEVILENYPNDNYFRLYYDVILFHLGNIQFMDHDYVAAINTYNKLLSIDSLRVDYQYKVNSSLGNIYFQNEEYSKAIQYFTTAIVKCDNNELKKDYFYSRGIAYFKNNDMELAVDDFNNACKLNNLDACDILKRIRP